MWNKQAELRETKSEISEPMSKAYFAGATSRLNVSVQCMRSSDTMLASSLVMSLFKHINNK